MKRFAALLCLAVAAAGLSSCGGDDAVYYQEGAPAVSPDPTAHGPRWDGTYVPPAQRAKQEVRLNQLPKLPTAGPHRF